MATVDNGVKTRLMRAAVAKKLAMAKLAAAKRKPPASPLVKVKAVHKGIIQVMPKKAFLLSSKALHMKKVGPTMTNKPSFKATRPATLRSPIKPRVSKKKLTVIKPVKKPLGRHLDLTYKGIKTIKGYIPDWGAYFEEFAGASGNKSPFEIRSGNNIFMSVPVDKPFEEPTKSAKLLISGIPSWLDPVKVYYDLLVYLAKHHLMLSSIDLHSHADGGKAAWAEVVLNFEAEKLLEAAGYQLSFPVHQVFSIPESIKLSPSKIAVSVVADARGLGPSIDQAPIPQ